MKAIVYHDYGSPDMLRLEEVPRPTPGDNEVLVRVRAASVNAGDWHLLRGDPWLVRLFSGLRRPKFNILGADIAGQVEAVGREVKQFQPGDEVFGDISRSGFGGFAEYACASESELVLKPANLDWEEAAAVPAAAMTALQALRKKGRVQPGERVLVNGASGGVGTFSVQIAKALGAEVTGVCSTAKLELVRSLGADHVIDYTQHDFTRSGLKYDVIHAVNGYHSLFAYRRALAPGGRYVMSGGELKQLPQAMLLGPWLSLGSRKMGSMLLEPNPQDLLFLKDLIESGQIAPAIDRRYPLAEAPEAVRYVETGHARGKVVIAV